MGPGSGAAVWPGLARERRHPDRAVIWPGRNARLIDMTDAGKHRRPVLANDDDMINSAGLCDDQFKVK